MNSGTQPQEYIFELANTKKRFYYLFALFIILINAVVLLLLQLNNAGEPVQNWKTFSIVLYSVLFIILFFLKSEKEKSILILFTFLLIIIAWLMMKEWLPANTNLLLFLLFKISTRSLKLIIRKENISYPSFPVKIVLWHELNNVILKEGLLTIDMKSNKVYQHYPEETKAIDEANFNLFCKHNLQTAG